MNSRPLRTLPTMTALAAGIHLVALTSPAFAQQAAPRAGAPAPAPVQPVPIGPAQPTQPLQPQQQAQAVVPGADTVVLNNGGTVKGTLVELLPDHVTVQLPNGQLAVIPSKDVHHIERQAATPGTPTPTPTPTPTTPAQITGPTVLMHIDTTRRVNLLYRPPGGAFDQMCESPCDQPVPLQGDYKLAANGVQASEDFSLRGSPGDRVVLHVNPGSHGTMVGGWVLFGIGGSIALVGLMVMAIGGLINAAGHTSSASTGTSNRADGDAVVATGGVMTLVGLAGAGVGLVLAIPNMHTHQEQEVVGKGAQAKPEDRWLRAPTWSAATTTAPRPTEAPLAIPLLRGTF